MSIKDFASSVVCMILAGLFLIGCINLMFPGSIPVTWKSVAGSVGLIIWGGVIHGAYMDSYMNAQISEYIEVEECDID